MIKFDRAAGNQSISTSDSALLTFPNGDWLLAFITGFDGTVTGNVTQYLFSSGAFAAAGSLNVVFYGAGVSGTTLQGRIAVYADTLANANAPALLSASQFSGGRYAFFLQRSGGTVTLYSCPVLSTAPIDGSAVVTEASTSSNSAILKALDGSGFMFGSRVDNTTDRKSDQSVSRMLRMDRTYSTFEMAQTAAGKEPVDLGYTPVLYVRASSISDITDRGPNAFPFTLAGTPTTSPEPSFAPASGTGEPAANAITVSSAQSLIIGPSAGNSAMVTFTGALGGTQPTSVEVRMIAPDGTLGNWVALQSATIGASAYTGVRAVPDGGPFTFQARSKSGATVLAESQPSTAKVLVGGVWGNAGSSSSDYLFTDKSGTGFTVAPNTAVISGATPTASAMSTTGAATRMASELAAKAGKPIIWLSYGIAGTTLRTWLDPNTTQRKNLAAAIAAMKGQLDGLYITVGANDAANGWITSSAAHLADMQKLVDDLRALTTRPTDLPIVWVGSPPRPGLPVVQAERMRQAESQIGNYPGVVYVQALQFATASDNVHLSPSLDGYAACGTMAMYQAGRFVYGGEDPKKVRGPSIASISYTSSKARVAITTRDGSDFSPAAPGGFTVQNKQADGSYVTLTGIVAQRVNAGLIEIECGVTLNAPIIKYLAGSAPNMANAVFSNGVLPLPMTVENEMVAVASSAVPVPDPEPDPDPGTDPDPEPEPEPEPDPGVPDERNYAWLQAEVVDWLRRKDMAPRVPKFITMAEARINRIVQARGMEVETTLAFQPGVGAVRLPVGFDTPIAAWEVVGDGRRDLSPVVPEQLSGTTQRGCPTYWAVSGAYLALDRPADVTRRVALRYRGLLRLSAAAPNNSVLTKYPDVYLYGALMEAAMFIRDQEALAMWASMFDSAMKELNRNESRARAIAPLRTELAGLLGRG